MLVCGLSTVAVRRRSLAVGLATCQALALAGIAIYEANTIDESVAAGALVVRAIALAGLLTVLVSRTRETIPVRASVPPSIRSGLAVGLALILIWLIPVANHSNFDTLQVSFGLIAFGMVIIATRRATLFQILGIIFIENAIALAALGRSSYSSLVIELGVTLDLALIAMVASVFHDRIFAEFGTGDVAMLSDLRD